MTESEIESLRQAVGTGEVLHIIYHGGSQPGAAREIVPVALTGDMLWALCLSSMRRKVFVLDRVAFPAAGETAPEYDLAAAMKTRPASATGSPAMCEPTGPLAGRIFCFTGALPGFSRDQAKTMVRAVGGEIAKTVVLRVTDLVVGDKPGEKLAKAKRQGVNVMSWQDFHKMVREMWQDGE